MRILLIEDDESIVAVLTAALSEQHYVIDSATDGELGWELATSVSYDLIVLDVMLPKMDGITLCRRLRADNRQVPIMVLTALDTATEKVVGLDSGADDYMIKPFNFEEFMARVRALLRRQSPAFDPLLAWGALSIDPNTREVTYGEQALQLSRKEYLLLELFLRHPNRVFSRRAIIEQLWSVEEDPPTEDTVRSHIKNLRLELKTVGIDDIIETVYGQGYRMNPDRLMATGAEEADSHEGAQRSLASKIKQIWERTKDTSIQRAETLMHNAQRLKQGALDSETYQAAIQTAHKLRGSLGTFGFEAESQLAQQVEQLLIANADAQQAATVLAQKQMAVEAESLTRALYHALTRPMAIAPPSHKEISSQASTCSAPKAIKPPHPAADHRSRSSPHRILVVDDDPQILRMVEAALESDGLKIIGLSDPLSFWKTLTSVQPELLILDINMPKVDGLELCRALRDHPEWSWLPVIFLTVQTDADYLKRAFEVGADDYVNKPIVFEELILRVSNRLQRSQALHNRATQRQAQPPCDRPPHID